MILKVKFSQAPIAALLFGAASFICAGAAAQAPAPAIEEDVEVGTPAMWRVADADSEVILLGTFHVLPPALHWRTDAFEEAFEKSDIVYFEFDSSAPDMQAKTLQIMMTNGFNPGGGKLTGLLEPDDAAKFEQIVKDLGLPLAGVDTMRPWQAFLTLTVQSIIKQGYDPSSGVDNVLSKEARNLGKELRFFETLEQQLGFFTGLSPETEKKLLVMTLRDWDNQADSIDRLYDAWRQGDADFIDAEMNAQMRDQAPEVFESLIVERNKAWAQALSKVIREGNGNIMVAVGAGHLVGGEHSVPALLAKEGFDVSRYGESD